MTAAQISLRVTPPPGETADRSPQRQAMQPRPGLTAACPVPPYPWPPSSRRGRPPAAPAPSSERPALAFPPARPPLTYPVSAQGCRRPPPPPQAALRRSSPPPAATPRSQGARPPGPRLSLRQTSRRERRARAGAEVQLPLRAGSPG